ncbi:MAG: acyl-CoA thioesterase [Opitutales bacterium]|nr:acyl-CoA thioesterase [Opitutales bacterium]
MISTSTKIKVRFAETDAMGIVYHANYLAWCECSRHALLESIGVNYNDLIEIGYHLPVVEAHLNYKSPAKFGDEVEVRVKITERPSVKIKIEYEIYRGKTLLVTGYTVHVFINLQGQPVKPPRDFLNSLRIAFDK